PRKRNEHSPVREDRPPGYLGDARSSLHGLRHSVRFSFLVSRFAFIISRFVTGSEMAETEKKAFRVSRLSFLVRLLTLVVRSGLARGTIRPSHFSVLSPRSK